MICTKCGSKNVVVGVSVFMHIDPENVYKITKKSTTLVAASWDKAQIVCKDCFYIHIGC